LFICFSDPAKSVKNHTDVIQIKEVENGNNICRWNSDIDCGIDYPEHDSAKESRQVPAMRRRL
jgi:hypothetical protein